MSATLALRNRTIVAGEHQTGVSWRELIAGVTAFLAGGAGLWSFLGKRAELRSKEAQELWERLESDATRARAEIDKIRETHEADMREMREMLAAEREKRFEAERARDAARADNVWLTGELGRQKDQIAKLEGQVAENRKELQVRDEQITDMRIHMERLQNRLGSLTAKVETNNGQSRDRDDTLRQQIEGAVEGVEP